MHDNIDVHPLELAYVFADGVAMAAFLTNGCTNGLQGLMVGTMTVRCYLSVGPLESAWWTANGIAKASLGGTTL